MKANTIKNLYVIGNGFDLYHHIKSKYSDFHKWLSDNEIDLLFQIEEILNVSKEDWWYQFEKNLGNIDLYEFISRITFENRPNYGSDDFVESDIYKGHEHAEKELLNLFNDIKISLYNWAKTLEKGNPEKRMSLAKDNSFFINFNYTKTLEDLYGINHEQILHIHGCIDEDNNNLVLGHNKTEQKLFNKMEKSKIKEPIGLTEEQYEEWQDDHSEDFLFDIVQEGVINSVLKIKKPVDSIIKANHSLFESLSYVEKIFIYGFSFSDIDTPYIDRIIECIDKKKVRWEISWHNENDKGNINTYMKRTAIDRNLWSIFNL